jgi:FkbM family methyltransferase
VDSVRSFRINHYGYQIENEVFWRGLSNSWERESMKLWLKLCASSQVILDIGANTGIYALAAKCIQPRARVFAFEPHPLFFHKLEENIRLNAFDIVALEKAVSDNNDFVTIEDYSGNTPTLKTACLTLDSLIESYGLNRIDLIKIDVEQHEPQVLAGFVTYLSRFKPTLLIEILTQQVAETVQKQVEGLGYLYFNIDENKGIRQTQRIEKSDYYNYLLCSAETASTLGLTISQR